jgi:hypothetical protein
VINPQVFREIESHDFAARLGFANDDAMLFDLAASESQVKSLTEALKQSPTNAISLLQRIIRLVQEEDDIRYRNSRDTAMAVYIAALSAANPALARLAAAEVLANPRLWWARKAALRAIGKAWVSQRPQAAQRAFYANSTTEVHASPEKDMLVVPEPSTELLRGGRVINPDTISVIGNSATTTLDEEAYKTTSKTTSRTKVDLLSQ